jgi:two-component system chemotaxis response regulator CheY
MKNILVLDDNIYILEALSANLCYYLGDCNIMTAIDGAKGAEVLSSTPVDLILTDIDMPVMKGYEFIEHAKKNYPGVPICVMSGDCSAGVREKLEALGVTRYIEKPFHYEKLVSMIIEELKSGTPIFTAKE